MKHMKYFESVQKPYREVDLQQLWYDLNKYQLQLFDVPVHMDAYFDSVIKKLILDKEIEFHRSEHPYDGFVSYAFNGRVRDIRIDIDSKYRDKKIIVSLYNSQEMYILTTIYSSVHHEQNSIVKIYNSEELEIEKKIEIARDSNKFNL